MTGELAEALIEARWADALPRVEALLADAPDDARLLYVRGVLLRQAWRMDEAMASYERSIALGYGGVGPYRERFQHLEKRGRLDEALAVWQLAQDRGLSTSRFHSHALDCRLKRPGATSEELLEAHRAWAACYAKPDPGIPPLVVEPFDGKRPLRVGYVCSFFEAPTIRYMLLPVIKQHDRARVRTVLYISGPLMMGETWRELYEPHVEAAREVFRQSDREFVEQVRGDQIDVLIDLNGMSGFQRYAAMASRCAPVQATYLNYTSTTAVENIDYAIGDRLSPPPGTEHFFTEQIARLDGCFFCFDYGDDPMLPPVAPGPAPRNGFVTFGCFGAGTKINGTLIDWWCEILRRVPDARFFIRNFEMSPADNRRALERQFTDRGIDASRLRLVGKGTRHDVVRSYADVDIALDTWPYCGGNTTAEALWQGVPVITRQGDRFSSSYGASLLHGAGCPELVAPSAEKYIEMAVALAGAPERLAQYRACLRSKVVRHGLGNAAIFAPRFEQALMDLRARAR